MKELWKPIPNYEGYEASNLGRIRSVDRYIKYTHKSGKIYTRYKSGRILKLHPQGGTRRLYFVPSRTQHIKVDLLIASIWVPNPNKYKYVIHLDGDRSNLRIDNLKWVPYISTSIIENKDEEWRPIPNYEDLYEVCNTGKVRSICRQVQRDRDSLTDLPIYSSKELKPCRYRKKSGIAVYHLHRRYKPGYYGQTDEYFGIEELMKSAFPELYKDEEI